MDGVGGVAEGGREGGRAWAGAEDRGRVNKRKRRRRRRNFVAADRGEWRGLSAPAFAGVAVAPRELVKDYAGRSKEKAEKKRVRLSESEREKKQQVCMAEREMVRREVDNNGSCP